MPRYIDADYLDELIAQLNHEGRGITRNEYKMMDNILFEFPTADVVEVVRCRECKHMMPDGRCFEFADDNIRPSASDFCSYGERKGESR